MSSLRILVADDNEFIRKGLCSILESRAGWIVCGQAADGKDAVEKAIELRPDVILVDLSMPRLNGFEVAECVHERIPDCGILVVTEHDPHLMENLSAQSGVSGFVAKSRVDLDLLSAVEAASSPSHLRSSSSAPKTV
jgi:two-component system response regulator NreC